MQNLNKQLKEGSFSNIYLLFGEESYLIRYYRDKLVKGILKDSPEGNVNYHYYEGDNATEDIIVNQAQMLPFFADTMLIVVCNSGLCKKSSDLAGRLADIPASTKIIMVEQAVDKRNSLYKYIKKNGTVAELSHKNDSELLTWVASYLKRGDCLITARAAKLLIAKVGVDMQQLTGEMEKLIAYAGEEKKIDIDEIEAITTTTLSRRIFIMMDYIVSGNNGKALELYKDLLALKESPMSIMALLTRHYNILLQIKDLQSERDDHIASIIGVPQFAVRKYRSQASAYSRVRLLQIVSECVRTEEHIKRGLIAPQTGIELLILGF